MGIVIRRADDNLLFRQSNSNGQGARQIVLATSEVQSFAMKQLWYDYLDSFSFIVSISRQLYFIRLRKIRHSMALNE